MGTFISRRSRYADSSTHTSVGDQMASEYDLMDQPYCGGAWNADVVVGRDPSRWKLQCAGGIYLCGWGGHLVAERDGYGRERTAVYGGRRRRPMRPAWLRDGMSTLAPSGNENLQNSTAIADRHCIHAERLAVERTWESLPLGCSAFCHPLYRFQFLGGPNYSGTSAGIGLHQWNPASSTWSTKFSVNGNGNLSTVGSGSFASGISVTGGETVTGGPQPIL